MVNPPDVVKESLTGNTGPSSCQDEDRDEEGGGKQGGGKQPRGELTERKR